MAQSKWDSFYESIVNTAIGYIVGLISQAIVFPFFNVHISLRTNIEMGLIFTVISIARQYVVRRWFTKRTE